MKTERNKSIEINPKQERCGRPTNPKGEAKRKNNPVVRGGENYALRTLGGQQERRIRLKKRSPKFTRPDIRNNNSASKTVGFDKAQNLWDKTNGGKT